MVKSRDQNAGRRYNIKIDFSFFEMLEDFKYLGTNLTNQNSIQEEISAGRNQGMLAIIWCRIIRLPFCYQKL